MFFQSAALGEDQYLDCFLTNFFLISNSDQVLPGWATVVESVTLCCEKLICEIEHSKLKHIGGRGSDTPKKCDGLFKLIPASKASCTQTNKVAIGF